MIATARTKAELVERGYDEIAERYHSERSRFSHRKELALFMGLLPARGSVLDAGCGAGVPVARTLARRGFQVTGIDLSRRMLALAAKNVPSARFLRMDMTRPLFDEDSFDGLTAFYSIIHVPREKHAKMFRAFHRILKPGGVILACLGPQEWEAVESYKGTKMFWSQHPPAKALKIVKDAGFKIIFERLLKRGGETHYWVLARNAK